MSIEWSAKENRFQLSAYSGDSAHDVHTSLSICMSCEEINVKIYFVKKPLLMLLLLLLPALRALWNSPQPGHMIAESMGKWTRILREWESEGDFPVCSVCCTAWECVMCITNVYIWEHLWDQKENILIHFYIYNYHHFTNIVCCYYSMCFCIFRLSVISSYFACLLLFFVAWVNC